MKGNDFIIVVHGGAGAMKKGLLTPEQEQSIHQGLFEAVEQGKKVLAQQGCAIDAAEHAVIELENNPWFNAGRGSVFDYEGKHQLDAAIMDGQDLNAGAVSGVQFREHPISLAKAVLEKSEHVMLASEGAEQFADDINMPKVNNGFFSTELRKNQWQRFIETGEDSLEPAEKDFKFGTVGAVAIDLNGNLAAATSTGGITGKRYSRVGDSPIIGCGTYANNKSCAVSATGHGEFFIRHTVAYNIAARMQFGGMTLNQAVNAVVMDELVQAGGEGGVIAISNTGELELQFNSEGMYRGWHRQGEETVTAIYKSDEQRHKSD